MTQTQKKKKKYTIEEGFFTKSTKNGNGNITFEPIKF